MKNVALIALLSAPAALAFIPADLQGVWHCVPEDGEYFTRTQYQENTVWNDIKWLSVDEKFSQRVIVFDKPNSKTTRHMTGRTYFIIGSDTEEHEFHGQFTNALHAELYMDPNSKNVECLDRDTTDTGLNAFTTDPLTKGQYLNPSTRKGTQADTSKNIKAGVDGMCKDGSVGPYGVVMEDVDHFQFNINKQDNQLKYYAFDNNASVGKSWDRPHVFVVEKCMRGLPEKSELCDNLKHSEIDTSSEMDDACQGALVCKDIDSSTPAKGKQCTVPPTPAPYQYVPQPFYQPQYYQPQYYQPQQYYYQPQQQYQPMWG